MRILAALLLFATIAHAEELRGKVVGISDGDTITLLTAAREQVKVRLDGIDAPETGQDFSAKAKEALSGKVYGKQVRIVTKEKDRYGRTIGTIYVGEENVNLWMVSQGLAWHYTAYSSDQALAGAQREAKASQ